MWYATTIVLPDSCLQILRLKRNNEGMLVRQEGNNEPTLSKVRIGDCAEDDREVSN